MRKILFASLLLLYTTNHLYGSSGGHIVGQYDNRKYASLSEHDYRGVAKLDLGTSRCTGVFIAENLVLTNAHCAEKASNGGTAEFWDGDKNEKANLTIAKFNETYTTYNGKDWAVLKSDKSNKLYRSIRPQTPETATIKYGGFGCLRIIKNEEIAELKQIYEQVIQDWDALCKTQAEYIECINDAMDAELRALGKTPLLEDSDKFKVQDCNITGTDGSYQNMVETNCDTASGNSGAPYLSNDQIVALHNSSPTHNLFDPSSVGAQGVKTQAFYSEVQTVIQKEQNSSATPPSGSGSITYTVSPTSDDTLSIDQMLENRLQYLDCD